MRLRTWRMRLTEHIVLLRMQTSRGRDLLLRRMSWSVPWRMLSLPWNRRKLKSSMPRMRSNTSARSLSDVSRRRMKTSRLQGTYDARHEKTDLKVFVVVIPKEGWARVAAPILLLVWHRLWENIVYDGSRVKFWKVGVMRMRTHPSFGMKTTKTLRSLLSWHASYVFYPIRNVWCSNNMPEHFELPRAKISLEYLCCHVTRRLGWEQPSQAFFCYKTYSFTLLTSTLG